VIPLRNAMETVCLNEKQNHPMDALAGRLIGTYTGIGSIQNKELTSRYRVLSHTVGHIKNVRNDFWTSGLADVLEKFSTRLN
jgi:hypothetical protein